MNRLLQDTRTDVERTFNQAVKYTSFSIYYVRNKSKVGNAIRMLIYAGYNSSARILIPTGLQNLLQETQQRRQNYEEMYKNTKYQLLLCHRFRVASGLETLPVALLRHVMSYQTFFAFCMEHDTRFSSS